MTDADAARAVARGFYGAEAAIELLPSQNHVVVRLRLPDGVRVLKLSRDATSDAIRKELTVIALLARHGVAVPAVEHADPEGRLAGRPCFAMVSAGERTVMEVLARRGDATRTLYREMGEALAAIHAVKVSGSGDFLPDGLIVPRDRAAWIARAHALGDWAAQAGTITPAEARRFQSLPMPEIDGAAVCHGEFHAIQCIERDGHVSAVVDWHEAWAGNPAIDLAIAQAYLDHYSPALTETFLRAYASRSGLTSAGARSLVPVRMAMSLALLKGWVTRGQAPGARRAVEVFRVYSRQIQ